MERYDKGIYANPNEHTGEGPFEDSQVETAGYMTAEQQIGRIMQAGENLLAWRRAHFPNEDAIPPDFQAPELYPDELDLHDQQRALDAAKAAAIAEHAQHAKNKTEQPKTETETPPENPEEVDKPPVT